MKAVEQYISYLLKEHDCVIVPGAGGFFTVKTGAGYDPGLHKFTAPGKYVSFNSKLTHNDGLLIAHIEHTEKVSNESAKKHVEHFARSLKNAFDKKEGVALSGLGTVYFDEHDKLRFTPDKSINYDEETFALEDFRAVPVQSASEPEQETPDEKVAEVSGTEHDTAFNWRYAAAAAVLLPFVGYAAWLIAFTGLLKTDQSFQAADLNPFSKKLCETYKPRATSVDVSGDWSLSESASLSFENGIARLRLVDDPETDPIIVGYASSKSAKGRSASGKKPYHVMAGAFRNKSNAERYVSRLSQAGFNSAVLDVKNGLVRVSAGSTASRERADELLAKVRQQIQPEAWVLTEK